jgi:MFS family permease
MPREPDARILWVSTAVSQLSFGMQQVVLGWVVLAMTDSSAMVGVAFALRMAPNLVVGFIAGAISDRIDRRTLMRLTTIGMGFFSLTVAWGAWRGALHVKHVLIYAALIGVLRAVETTARQAYIYDLIGLQGAVHGLAFNAIAQRMGGAVGALIAGWALASGGSGAAFFAISLCFGLGAILLYLLRNRGIAAPAKPEPLWQNVTTYVRELRSNPILWSLIISTAMVEIIGFSHQTLLPVLARDTLHIGAAGLGMITAFRFVGGLLGALWLTVIRRISSQGIQLLWALALFGVGQICLSQVTQLWLAVVCIIGINVMASATDILHQFLLQTHVPNTQRGRAIGAWIVGTGMAPLGHLQIGYLAGVTSVSAALLINGFALLALPLCLVWLMPQLRRL